jgi:hypothetical protein
VVYCPTARVLTVLELLLGSIKRKLRTGVGSRQACATGYPSFRYLAGGMPTSRLKALRKATSDS